MNAGISGLGQRFAAKHADIACTSLQDHHVLEQGDHRMAELLLSHAGPNWAHVPPAVAGGIRNTMMAGSGGGLLPGNADEITAKLQMLSDCGVDGVWLTWMDCASGLDEFGRTILPSLGQAGLRAKLGPAAGYAPTKAACGSSTPLAGGTKPGVASCA